MSSTIDIPSTILSGDQLTRLSKFGKIYLFDTIGSTQDFAKKLARIEFKPETDNQDLIQIRSIVIAHKQTAGIGRHGAKWLSSEQGIHFSILFAYPKKYHSISIWTLLCAKLIAETLEQMYNLPIFIKWPNDLVSLDRKTNDYRKLGGIIAETKSSGGLFHSAGSFSNIIFGIGINVNQDSFPPDLSQATSLRQEMLESRNLNKELNRGDILYKIIENMAGNLSAFETLVKDSADKAIRMSILDDIKQRSMVIGKRVVVSRRMGTISGNVLDIDVLGRLIIRTDASRIVTIDSGHIVQIKNI